MKIELPRLTANTITVHEALRHHLEQIRAEGIAVDNEEHIIGVGSLAAPVYDHSGQPIAAIGISGPTVRFTPQTLPSLIKTVTQVATALSKSLGYELTSNDG